MSFPNWVDADEQTSSQDTNSTAHTITLATNTASGDRCFAGIYHRADAGEFTWPDASWNVIINDARGTASRLNVAYRDCDGTEGANIEVGTSSAGTSVHFSGRVENNTGTAPDGTAANGASTTPDPPSHTAAETADILWLAGCGRNNNASPTGIPTNYTQLAEIQTAGANCDIVVAERELNAASEDPSNYTYASGTQAWVAFTVAVYPSANFVVARRRQEGY